MASPVETTTPVSSQPDEFDLLEFWIRYKGRIILFAGLLIAAAAIYGGFRLVQQRQLAASDAALATAKNADDYRKLIGDYPTSPAAASATLLLAERLREAGKYDEAATSLKGFIDRQPEHSLVSAAWLSLGAVQEAQGKTDDALTTYRKIASSYPGSFAAPSAWVAQGRILHAQGKNDEARRAYETVVTQFGQSPFVSIATREMQKLKK